MTKSVTICHRANVKRLKWIFFVRRANVTIFQANVISPLHLLLFKYIANIKRVKLFFLMKVNMTKSDANIKFSIIFAAL